MSNRVVRQFSIFVCTLFITIFPGTAADPIRWGAADNELRLSLSLSVAGNMQVTFENTGEKEVLVPLGVIYDKPHPTFLKPFLRTPDGGTPRVVYTGLGVIEGVIEPLTMGLRAGETYTLALPLDRYYMLDRSETLATFIKRRRCHLWVELDVQESQCPNPRTLDPIRRTLPCWHGKVVSNIFELPE